MPSEAISALPAGPGHAPLPALSRAELRVPQTTRDGRTVPARSSGTIVEVLGGGRAYMIEFVTPFAALLTVEAGSVRPVTGGA